MITDNCIKVHPANRKAQIYHIKVKENTVSLSEHVEYRWVHFSSDDSNRYKRGLYLVDISCYQATDSTDDTIWKNCLRYNVTKNTVLKVLVEAMGTCYDISNCLFTNKEAKNTCNRYTSQINSLLQPYNIRTEMTLKSWQFYYNDAPITLEEVIKKIPDDVLYKRLDPPARTPIKAPTPVQSQPSPSYPRPGTESPYTASQGPQQAQPIH